MIDTSQIEQNRKKEFSKALNALFDEWKEKHGRKLTQEELAKYLYVQRETVSAWVNGRQAPTNQGIILKICDFFGKPRWHFDNMDYSTETSAEAHKDLHSGRLQMAQEIGLSPSLVSFLKEIPACADAIVHASWVDAYTQPFSPDIPTSDSPFQFVSSAGTKVYIPGDVLMMLRLVQRDLSEYALFKIQQYSKVINDFHDSCTEETRLTDSGVFGISGKEYTYPAEQFANELNGMGSLSAREALLIQIFQRLSEDEKREVLQDARKVYSKSRKENSKEYIIPSHVAKVLSYS